MRAEAERVFPQHVMARTAHSLAYRGMNMRAAEDRVQRRIDPRDIVDRFGVTGIGGPRYMTAARALKVIETFCHSKDEFLGVEHVWAAGIRLANRSDADRLAVLAASIWDDVQDTQGKTNILPDHYLKMFHLSGKSLAERPAYILFDESQDADQVMVDIVRRQGVPVFYVGDRHQQLYRWRGAINAMRQIDLKEFPLTKSFRFGPAVADLANFILNLKVDGPDHELIGNEEKETLVDIGQPTGRYTYLSRTNAGLFDFAARQTGPIYMVGKFDDMSRTVLAAAKLYAGERQQHIPALSAFGSWSELTGYLTEVADTDLLYLSRLADTYRDNLEGVVDDMRRRLVPNEKDAEISLSTVHQFKGKESPKVKLGDDFPVLDETFKERDPDGYDDELSILYVGATRGTDEVYINSLLLDLARQ
jgi:superfamily I DNA/RNA helicase